MGRLVYPAYTAAAVGSSGALILWLAELVAVCVEQCQC